MSKKLESEEKSPKKCVTCWCPKCEKYYTRCIYYVGTQLIPWFFCASCLERIDHPKNKAGDIISSVKLLKEYNKRKGVPNCNEWGWDI